MPGIITHNKLFKESIALLQKKKKRNYLLRSLQSLFSENERLTAALFGSIGPNIFDYLPKRSRGSFFGSAISFSIHNGLSRKIIESLYDVVFSQKDLNTEWSSMQRAYLYGYVSHMISDSVFHPFVFYFSGFGTPGSKYENSRRREQFLAFEYAMDLYFLLFRNDSGSFRFSIQEMIPLKKHNWFKILSSPVKAIILESLYNDFRDFYKAVTFMDSPDQSGRDPVRWHDIRSHIDAIPYFLSWTYRVKMTRNVSLRDYLVKARRKRLLTSDFTVLYPQIRTFDLHLVNHYRERWQYPAGPTALRYESAENLVQIACDRIVETWERLENSIYSGKRAKLSDLVVANSYTGVNDQSFSQMKLQNPVMLRF
jgi:hypothetical protein